MGCWPITCMNLPRLVWSYPDHALYMITLSVRANTRVTVKFRGTRTRCIGQWIEQAALPGLQLTMRESIQDAWRSPQGLILEKLVIQ